MVFQAVVKSAVSAAPQGQIQEIELQGNAGRRLGYDRVWGAPLELGHLDLVFGEAAVAADWITSWKTLMRGRAI